MNTITFGDDTFFARYKVDYISSSLAHKIPIHLQMCVSKDSFYFYEVKNIANLVLCIPHDKIRYFSFVNGTGLRKGRTGLLKNFDNGLLNNIYKNEMQFDYIDTSNQNALFRVGMATSIFVARRTTDCQHLEQLLRTYSVYGKFSTVQQTSPSPNVMAQIEKLGELHKSGALTDEEFQSKKTELLGKL